MGRWIVANWVRIGSPASILADPGEICARAMKFEDKPQRMPDLLESSKFMCKESSTYGPVDVRAGDRQEPSISEPGPWPRPSRLLRVRPAVGDTHMPRGAAGRFVLGTLMALVLAVSGCVSQTGTATVSSTPGISQHPQAVQPVTSTIGTGDPNAPGAPSPARSEPIELWRNDVRLVGTLEVPALAANERVPLVILAHGFTSSQNEPLIRATAQALQEAHVASIRFDFEAHGASGGQQVDMTVPNEIQDAQVVYDYARSLPFVSKIGLVGHSQGGVVAAMLAGQLGEHISALVLFAPATVIPDNARAGDILGARFDPNNPPDSITVNGFQVGRGYIVTAQSLPVWEVPARYTGSVSLIQGAADQIVPVGRSEQYVTIFAHGQLHVLPGQDHSFSSDPGQPAALAADFLAANLR
jgi:uncharacterized protein